MLKTLLLSPAIVFASLVLTASAGAAEPGASAKPAAAQLGAFFTAHCRECHGGGSKEGNLDLEQIDFAIGGRASVEQWTRIYDRVERGEMPPVDSKQPTAKERAEML